MLADGARAGGTGDAVVVVEVDLGAGAASVCAGDVCLVAGVGAAVGVGWGAVAAEPPALHDST